MIAKAETGWWKTATPREIVAFQLYEPLLCMPFNDYQAAVEAALGRPVWTHEFAQPQYLRVEFERNTPSTMTYAEAAEHALGLLETRFPGKTVVVGVPELPAEGSPDATCS